MEKIIDPVPVELLKAELTPERKLCDTNKGDNEIYVVDCKNAPNVLREIGRLREITFREAGGCSGKEMDLDEFDFLDNPYQQIIVWNPDADEIIGGYRYILGANATLREDGQPNIFTADMFHFSDNFIQNYLEHTIELGRSFVTPAYQSSKAGAKAIYTLDNLWDGIGAVMMRHTQCFYFLGKMTIHPNYDKSCCDLIFHFLNKHFPDDEQLIRPHHPLLPSTDTRLLDLILNESDLKQDYRCLKNAIRKLGFSIPPLVNSYINTSPTMKMLGSAFYYDFNGAQEMGILVCFNEMYEDKRDRHIEPFFKAMISKARHRFPSLGHNYGEEYRQRVWQKRMNAFNNFIRKRKN